MEAVAGGGWDLNSLVAVLTQGEAQLQQLCSCMAARCPGEQEKQLVLRAQSCFKTAICMAKAANSDLLQAAAAAANSPHSNSGCSAKSERALKEQQRKEMCKKRKTLRKWTSRVPVLGLDGHDDGFSWRKYGQKDILGAKYPRAYFRCTFRNAAGCPAMKQAQRSDDDPSVIDVTYRGDHTCLQSKKHQPGAGEPPALSSEPEQKQQPPPDRQLLLSLQTSLKVETEGFSSDDQDHNCFSFASTPASGAVSPPVVSPTTPESSSFWLSSDFGDLFSAVTPANDYSSYMDFMLDSAGFAAASTFDTSAFFHDSEI
ncbi:WRKY DNA-binding transcription factor 70-like [Curcuma longa]|uniref:WRKY DNA-binding transcription factor 70-like n=1 Tax=Curcuma longa TaxID=136217 RepID=UPI003D9EA1EB